jgi:hypothetical protein
MDLVYFYLFTLYCFVVLGMKSDLKKIKKQSLLISLQTPIYRLLQRIKLSKNNPFPSLFYGQGVRPHLGNKT